MTPGDVVIVLNVGNLAGPHANIHVGALGVVIDTKNLEVVEYAFVQVRGSGVLSFPVGVWVRNDRLESLGTL